MDVFTWSKYEKEMKELMGENVLSFPKVPKVPDLPKIQPGEPHNLIFTLKKRKEPRLKFGEVKTTIFFISFILLMCGFIITVKGFTDYMNASERPVMTACLVVDCTSDVLKYAYVGDKTFMMRQAHYKCDSINHDKSTISCWKRTGNVSLKEDITQEDKEELMRSYRLSFYGIIGMSIASVIASFTKPDIVEKYITHKHVYISREAPVESV